MKLESKIKKVCPASPEPDIIAQTAGIINSGGVIVFPTERLYGLGADAFNIEAVNKIFSIKNRPQYNPILVLIKDRNVLERLVKHVTPVAEKLMKCFWPGKITLVFEAKGTLPSNLTAGSQKIGVRIPGHTVASALVNAVDNPITGTSANISSESGCSQISGLSFQIAEKVDIILDADQLKGGKGSTVVDVTLDPPEILREGEISANEIIKILSNR